MGKGRPMRLHRCSSSIFAVEGFIALSTAAQAQTTGSAGGASGHMWGASSTSGPNFGGAHVQDGNAAGQVNAARSGLLLNGGPNMSISSIGSQSIISTTVIGDNNTTTVTGTQTSTNSGTVTNTGTINAAQP